MILGLNENTIFLSIKTVNVCPISLDQFYIVTYYSKWAKTSWTYNRGERIGAKSLKGKRQEVKSRERQVNQDKNIQKKRIILRLAQFSQGTH